MPDYRKMTPQQKAANNERRRIGRERHAEEKARRRGSMFPSDPNIISLKQPRSVERSLNARAWRKGVFYDPTRPVAWRSRAFVCGEQVDAWEETVPGAEERAFAYEVDRARVMEWGALLGAASEVPRFEVSIAEMVERAPVRARRTRRTRTQGEDGYSMWGEEEAEERWEIVGDVESDAGWDDDDWGELLNEEGEK